MSGPYRKWELLAVAVLVVGCKNAPADVDDAPGMHFSGLEEKYLHSKTTIALAEKEHAVTDDRLGPAPVAFGFSHKYWVRLKSELRQGDELWNYAEPGGAGICIVRSKKVLRCMPTAIV
jgi:hypothetical protein